MPPRPPGPPKISHHLPKLTPLREMFADARSAIGEVRQDIHAVASFMTPRADTKKQAPPKPAAECKPCQQMKELQEVVGRRKVKKALDDLKAGQGDKETNVETLRKYVEGEDV